MEIRESQSVSRIVWDAVTLGASVETFVVAVFPVFWFNCLAGCVTLFATAFFLFSAGDRDDPIIDNRALFKPACASERCSGELRAGLEEEFLYWRLARKKDSLM